MRTFLRDHWKAIVAIILLVVLAMFTINTGDATPAPSLAARLRTHVTALAPGADLDLVKLDAAFDPAAGQRRLRQAARYIEATLRGEGYAIRRRDDGTGGRSLPDIEVSVANLAPHARPARIFIVGAHVGVAAGDPAAGDPAAGVPAAGDPAPDADGSDRRCGGAAVLELARLLRTVRPSQGTEIRFVFFFGAAPARPDEQDFIAFVGTLASARPVQQALAAFQDSLAAPARGLAAPAYVQGATLSGHAASLGLGAPAILVLDTAFGRYPYFEAAADAGANPPGQPGQPDYAAIARVVSGLARTLEALAAGRRG